ncbi:MAG: RNase adapter RapZ [Sulfitobacter sp.]|jgi:RNase adapter protein RapZ|uniref:RNase adapter RapZ n=1 Tax=Sulfitobacter sp. TaxID=1903071 RepID=UPI000C0CD81A|nr:RNase adapter RapZ [Roseobacter sp.]MBV49697.1 RNase adapter RapZ [Roseobacter sp.]PHR06888.1 MAG: RNase adapter RapZ [Sulfitobacter sp.]THF74095.1 MAG: RNase adapter RapZ [Sulfitobacter sp. SK025]|tara:strand:- start:4718 stop:5611 length:894 start_codon:yes stop_codon:yes gene_type:complete
MTDPIGTTRRIVLVTGPAGAGRSSTLNVLEDAGFEAIDNIPLRMLRALLDAPGQLRPMALGIDPRNRDFSTDMIAELLMQMRSLTDVSVELLYLDCATDVLLRRFSETRRRHPMADSDSPVEGIRREKELLAPIQAMADVLINTTELNVHELRREVEHWFARDGQHSLNVSVQSFSYKRGLPRSADMVFDCRFLRNPFWEPSLRQLNGTNVEVARYVSEDPLFAPFSQQVLDLSLLILPACKTEGKSHISLAFGCTGGQHRSVTLAEFLALRLAKEGWQVSIRHRELGQNLQEEKRH